MHQAHEEDTDYQPEEQKVVLLAHAVIQPAAMVVKAFDAPVAGAAVLGGRAHGCLTDVALKLISRAIKYQSAKKSK